jgi:hypothetical protein
MKAINDWMACKWTRYLHPRMVMLKERCGEKQSVRTPEKQYAAARALAVPLLLAIGARAIRMPPGYQRLYQAPHIFIRQADSCPHPIASSISVKGGCLLCRSA